jgi:hypothetical protein
VTKEQKIIRAKVGLLELARQLGNVSQACKMMGYGSVRNLVCGAIVTPMEGAYGNQERHPGRFAGGA